MAPGADIARVERRAGGALHPAACCLGIARLAVFEAGHQPAQPPRRSGRRRGCDRDPQMTPRLAPQPRHHRRLGDGEVAFRRVRVPRGQPLQRRRLGERPRRGVAVEVNPGEVGLGDAAPGAFNRLPRRPRSPQRQQQVRVVSRRRGDIGDQRLRLGGKPGGAAQVALPLGLAALLVQHGAPVVPGALGRHNLAPHRVGDRAERRRPIAGARLQRQEAFGQPRRRRAQLMSAGSEAARGQVIAGPQRLAEQTAQAEKLALRLFEQPREGTPRRDRVALLLRRLGGEQQRQWRAVEQGGGALRLAPRLGAVASRQQAGDQFG